MSIAQRFTTCLVSLLILALIACTSPDKRPGEYIDDAVLTVKVKSALIADPELKATEINVETYKGTVQLSGFVASPDHVQKATRLAHDIKGVRAVKNVIGIKK
ncbi:BON domain-containing protein [Massilia cavernae]|nr:BON domain-containing protein [Massilia cavernae]